MKYVSLGSSCGVTTFLQSAKLKGPNCPFDWALTSPQFVLEMTKLALSPLPSEEIIKHHFFTFKIRINFFVRLYEFRLLNFTITVYVKKVKTIVELLLFLFCG